MSSVLGYNTVTLNGTFLNEKVLRDDNVNYVIANSVQRAVVDHLIYYLREYFSDVIFQYSATSGNTTVTIYGKYPEEIANTLYPAIIVYIQNNTSKQKFIGDVARELGGGDLAYARWGNYEIIFDIWGRTQLEVEAVAGALGRILDDANHDINFLKRGFSESYYAGTLGREFDITDKIVQTVSHLDSSINIRREQLVFTTGFFYRIKLPKGNVDSTTYINSLSIQVQSEGADNEITTVVISPAKKIYSQGVAISSV